MALIRVDVTQKDIDNGATDPSTCPIALALADAGLRSASVGPGDAGGLWEGMYVTGSLPAKAQRFVADFDLDGPDAVRPFSFEMELT